MIFRRIRAIWTGACCRCERQWGEHWDDCQHRPVYLCRRCVKRMALRRHEMGRPYVGYRNAPFRRS